MIIYEIVYFFNIFYKRIQKKKIFICKTLQNIKFDSRVKKYFFQSPRGYKMHTFLRMYPVLSRKPCKANTLIRQHFKMLNFRQTRIPEDPVLNWESEKYTFAMLIIFYG